MSKWIPGIGNILAVSSVTLLFFGLFTLLLCYTTGDFEVGVGQLARQIGGNSLEIPSFMLTFVEAYLWIGMATFAAGGAIAAMFANVLPPTFMFYIFTVLAGFLAGLLLFWRKPNRILNSFLAPLLTALYVTIIAVVVNSVVSSLISSAVSDVLGRLGGETAIFGAVGPALGSAASMDATGYVLVFFITYGMVTIGTFLAALLWELVYWHKEHGTGAPAPAQPAPKQKAAKKSAKK